MKNLPRSLLLVVVFLFGLAFTANAQSVQERTPQEARDYITALEAENKATVERLDLEKQKTALLEQRGAALERQIAALEKIVTIQTQTVEIQEKQIQKLAARVEDLERKHSSGSKLKKMALAVGAGLAIGFFLR